MKFLLPILTSSILNFFQPQFNWFTPLYEERNFFLPLHSTSPVIYKEIIVAPGKNALTAINLNNGRKIWSKEFPDEIASSPVLYNERIFLSTLAGKIYIINPQNGQIIKEVTIINSSIISDFAFIENKSIFMTDKDELITIDINSGEILWSYRRKKLSDFIINSFPAPVIHNDIAYAGFSDGVLAGIDISTGKEKWSFKLPSAKRFEGIYASPVIYKDKLIVPKYDSGLYSISINDNKIVWAREDEGYQWCVINKDYLYCASLSGELLKITPYSGNSYWKIDFISNKRSFFKKKLLTLSEPEIMNNIMYVSAQKGIYAIELEDGKIVWQFKPSGVLFAPGISAPPLINGENLIFVSNSGLLYNFLIAK